MKSDSQRRSQAQEKRVALELGGRVQKASGATPFAKGDVHVAGELKVECKTTSSRRFTLKVSEVLKIQREALMGSVESWVMQIEFQGAVGSHHKLAVLEDAWFLQLGGSATSRVSGTVNVGYSLTRETLNTVLEWKHHKGMLVLRICPWSQFLSIYEKRQKL